MARMDDIERRWDRPVFTESAFNDVRDAQWLIAEVIRLRRELERIRDGGLSSAAMRTVALEALLPTEERGDAGRAAQDAAAG